MTTQAQIYANRCNAQKSTGPRSAEGKAIVAQNALKHGLFAQKNVICCEKPSDFYIFHEELLTGLAPVGGVETMMAERIVSLSWRLKRVERMNSEAIDVMIARAETDRRENQVREETGLLDPESGRSELVLGWVTNYDFSGSNAMLERLADLRKTDREQTVQGDERASKAPAHASEGASGSKGKTNPIDGTDV